MSDRTSHKPLLFDRAAVREVDRRCIEAFRIPGVVLMENAADALLDAAIGALDTLPAPGRSALIAAGPGNNGGDGFALARKLHNAGIPVAIALACDPESISGDAGVNLAIAQRMGLPIHELDKRSVGARLDTIAATLSTDGPPGLIVDALLGTGLTRAVRPPIADVVAWINRRHDAGVRVLAADIPTGLDCDLGEPLGATVVADVTVTFVGVKRGFLNASAQRFVGEVIVGDIGAPIELVRELGQPLG